MDWGPLLNYFFMTSAIDFVLLANFFFPTYDQCTRLDKIRSEVIKKRTGDLCNTRRETQIQTKLDQPPRKNGQHRTPETRPQLQTPRKKRS